MYLHVSHPTFHFAKDFTAATPEICNLGNCNTRAKATAANSCTEEELEEVARTRNAGSRNLGIVFLGHPPPRPRVYSAFRRRRLCDSANAPPPPPRRAPFGQSRNFDVGSSIRTRTTNDHAISIWTDRTATVFLLRRSTITTIPSRNFAFRGFCLAPQLAKNRISDYTKSCFKS